MKWNTVNQEKTPQVIYGARQVVGSGVKSSLDDEPDFIWIDEMQSLQIMWS